jgi:hypothetical protein
MRCIISIVTFITVVYTLTSAAPLTPRGPIPITPTFFEIIAADSPNSQFGTTLIPQISISGGSHEIASFVSFSIPPITGATSTSTCQFILRGVTATSSSAIQLFSLGYQLTGSETFNSHPYYNQDEGQYRIDPNTGNSTPLYGGTVPCNIGGAPTQFIIRPHFTEGSITWTQTNTVGAFLEITL